LVELGSVEDLTFNTHNISLGRLEEFFTWPTWVLGIQPRDLTLGEGLSSPVQLAAGEITGLINQQP
jgi:hypothetical protein